MHFFKTFYHTEFQVPTLSGNVTSTLDVYTATLLILLMAGMYIIQKWGSL
jgi:hypothetical protein